MKEKTLYVSFIEQKMSICIIDQSSIKILVFITMMQVPKKKKKKKLVFISHGEQFQLFSIIFSLKKHKIKPMSTDQKADPPLDKYTVKDIQNLSYPNLSKFYSDLVKAKVKSDPSADIDAYMNDLNEAFDKARVPGTREVDNAIYSIITAYRSYGHDLEANPDEFRAFQQDLLDSYLPALSAPDGKDVRRVIMSLGKTY
jgi:hypothetical protein